ncbi:MAG TPA: VOC family protein [Streptosporangiaceae bacterium]
MLSFQHAPGHQPPRWPGPAFPQQVHLDIRVAGIDAVEAQVLVLGATRLPSAEPGFRVCADPAGHPFCLEWGNWPGRRAAAPGIR